MASRDWGSSSGEISGSVYVAVGSDAAESETSLLWALQNFGGEFTYCILHVRQPGGQLNPPEFARQNMNEILDAYIQMCNLAEVSSMKVYAEMQDVGQGIVELVEQHCIRKLVMGAAANCHYIEGMSQLRSTKAMFVNQHAHPSCEIWFICRGNPVYLRESRSSTSYPSEPGSSHFQSGQSTPGSDNSASDSSKVVDNLALVQFEGLESSDHSSETNPVPAVHQPPSNAAERSNGEELCKQLERAMSEVTKAKREALEELIRRQKAERAAIEAKRKVGVFENLYAEELSRRINLEEMLEKERERCRMIENEKNDLQMLFENALKANEELSANQASEPSSLNWQDQEAVTKFSFSEIQEATDNLDPSTKIEEGDYGSTYKGFLRHARVAIKMTCSDSSQGPSQYHQEIVHFRSLEKPKEDDFSLEMSKLYTYDDVVERVAQQLGLHDASKIRLTSHNCYTQQPKPHPIKYRGVVHLSDMLVHYNQSSDILYYEVLDIPFPELQGLKTLKVAFHHATKDEVVIHTIRLPKQSIVGAVLSDLKTKVELSEANAELRLLEIFYHKIYKIFPLNEKIENINDQYWTLRAEEILEEEKNLGPNDCLIHVYHFTKDTAQNQMQVQNFGEPFLLVIHEGETLAEIKGRVQKKLQVPDEEFAKWRFAFLSLGRPEYLQDHDIVSNCFQDVYGAWEQYLGLEHSDTAPKRAHAANQNRHTLEMPVKIYN